MSVSISIEAKYQLASLKADFSILCSFPLHSSYLEESSSRWEKSFQHPSNWTSLMIHVPPYSSELKFVADFKSFSGEEQDRIPFLEILWKRCWLLSAAQRRGRRNSKSKFEFPGKDTAWRKVCQVKGKTGGGRSSWETKFKVTKFFYVAKPFDKFKSTLIHEPFFLHQGIPL